MLKTLYLVGYGWDPEGVLNAIPEFDRVIDIRYKPWSRIPGFKKEELQERFPNYRHVPEWGGGGNHAPWSRMKKLFDALNEALETKKILIMCSERDPHRCHRLHMVGYYMHTRYGVLLEDLWGGPQSPVWRDTLFMAERINCYVPQIHGCVVDPKVGAGWRVVKTENGFTYEPGLGEYPLQVSTRGPRLGRKLSALNLKLNGYYVESLYQGLKVGKEEIYTLPGWKAKEESRKYKLLESFVIKGVEYPASMAKTVYAWLWREAAIPVVLDNLAEFREYDSFHDFFGHEGHACQAEEAAKLRIEVEMGVPKSYPTFAEFLENRQ